MKKKILSKDEVLHLAKLAKLSLIDEEIKKYQQQLGETLDYVNNLNEIKTENIEDHFSSSFSKNVFFEDKVSLKRVLSADEVFRNAKRRNKGYFGVKRIL